MPSIRPVAVLMALAVLGVAQAPVAQAGGVYVATLPDGADVWLDGAYVGRSPVLLDGMLPGKHTVTVSRFGWDSQDTSLDVASGALAGTLIQLRRAVGSRAGTGRLQLHVPTGATALLDGSALALDAHGGAIVPAGEHAVVVHTRGGRFDRSVRVYPDMTTDVVLASDTAPVATGKSSVVAPAEDYLPAASFHVTGTRVLVKYKTHVVVARVGETQYVMDGKTVSFDAAPALVHDKLYLPLALLVQVTGAKE